MDTEILVDLALNGNSVKGNKIEHLAADPTGTEAYEGRLYYNTASKLLRIHTGSGFEDVTPSFKVFTDVNLGVGTGLYINDGTADFTLPAATGSGARLYLNQTGVKATAPPSSATIGDETLDTGQSNQTYNDGGWRTVIEGLDLGQLGTSTTLTEFFWNVSPGTGPGNPPDYKWRFVENGTVIYTSDEFDVSEADNEPDVTLDASKRLDLEVFVIKNPSGSYSGKNLRINYMPAAYVGLGSGNDPEPSMRFLTETEDYTAPTLYNVTGTDTINGAGGFSVDEPVILKFIDVEAGGWYLAPYKPVTKASLGLANVNNTSDIHKPVSGPTQTQVDRLDDRIDALASQPDEADLNKTTLIGTAATTWTTTHTMQSKNPSVTLYDSAGTMIYGQVSFSGKTITVEFNSAESGRIELN
jgi:hypothetical protein